MFSKLLILLLIAGSPKALGAKAADQLVFLLSEIDNFAARYEQDSQNTSHTGRLWLSRPDRFRMQASATISQTVVSDGNVLWTHDLDLEQVIISHLNDRALDIPLLLFAGEPQRVYEFYEVERHDHGALTRFALTPLNQTGSVGRIVLGFSGGVPIEFLFETAMDRQTIIRLFDVSLDDIDAKVYDFKMPEGVDVIDDRAGVN